jgi:uncharacterized protein YjiS (DUF1127 family)
MEAFLHGLSDAELAELGLRREDIPVAAHCLIYAP